MLSAPLSMGLLGAVGFVATHHLQPGTNRRDNTRAVATEIAAGASLLILTLACHSIYPAMVAHALNNGPGIALDSSERTGRGTGRDAGTTRGTGVP